MARPGYSTEDSLFQSKFGQRFSWGAGGRYQRHNMCQVFCRDSDFLLIMPPRFADLACPRLLHFGLKRRSLSEPSRKRACNVPAAHRFATAATAVYRAICCSGACVGRNSEQCLTSPGDLQLRCGVGCLASSDAGGFTAQLRLLELTLHQLVLPAAGVPVGCGADASPRLASPAAIPGTP